MRTARIGGFDVEADHDRVRKLIGFLPEQAPSYSDMTLSGYLEFMAGIKGLDRRAAKSEMERTTTLLNLQRERPRLLRNLSKGTRQRAAIAQALLGDPEVLLLDEPTVGLDPSQIREARRLISELAGDHTVMLSTHILQEVEIVCQRVIILANKRIVAQGTPDELKNRAGGGLRVEVRGPGDEVKTALAGLPGVNKVEVVQTGPVGRFNMSGKLTPELREQVAATVSAKGWSLRELRTEGIVLRTAAGVTVGRTASACQARKVISAASASVPATAAEVPLVQAARSGDSTTAPASTARPPVTTRWLRVGGVSALPKQPHEPSTPPRRGSSSSMRRISGPRTPSIL